MTAHQNTRERVISRATQLIRRKGFRATSIGEIIVASGIKKGGLYHHFQDKDQLGMEILQRAEVELYAFLDNALAGDSPIEGLFHFLDAVLIKHKKTRFVGGCIFGNTALEMADDAKPFADAIARVFAEWIHKIEIVIRRAQKLGQVRGDLSPRALAQHVVMTIEGGIMLSRLGKTERPLKECLRMLKQILLPNSQQER